MNITMHPSWIVYAAFAAIVFVAIGRVGRLASTVEQAGRIFDRAAIAVMTLAAVSIIVGGLWLASSEGCGWPCSRSTRCPERERLSTRFRSIHRS